MSKELKIAVIGLDTFHSVQYPAYIQDPSIPAEKHVDGARVTRALRFPSTFQSEEGQDARQAKLEALGILVTRDFNEAVADCDAIMMEINDPALHLEYFRKCAPLGKPIFIDKPFADTMENAREIIALAKKYNVRFCTSSCRRFDHIYLDKLATVDFEPKCANVWGSLGTGPDGTSTFIWYGVHEFEIMERVMGRGAATVSAREDDVGFVCHVTFKDGRRAVVEGCTAAESYGIMLRHGLNEAYVPCCPNPSPATELIRELVVFFNGGPAPVELEDSLEVFAMTLAADKSAKSGKPEPVEY